MAEVKIFQFRITLAESNPPIWRRIQVPASFTFYRLHWVIQFAMGWTNSHLHQFHINENKIIGDPRDAEEWPEDMGVEVLDEKKTKLFQIFKNKEQLDYEYDFGDSWRHEVRLEKTLTGEAGVKYPICMEGEYKCPPEDVGGIHGYYRMLESLANPDDDEHEEFLQWLGKPFDPKEFDLNESNRWLSRSKFTQVRTRENYAF